MIFSRAILIGVLIQFISIFGNSTSILSAKFASSHAHPVCLLCYGLFFNTLFLLLFLKLKKAPLVISGVSHVLSTTGCFIMGVISLYAGFYLLTPTAFGFLGRFFLVFSIFFGVTILKEKLSVDKLIAITLVLVGSFLFASNEEGLAVSLWGVVAVIGYCLFFALSNAFIKLNEAKEDYVLTLTYNNGIALVLAVSAAMYLGVLEVLPMRALAWIVFSSFCSAASNCLFFESLKYLSYAYANTLRSFSPIAMALISWPFFPMHLSALNIVGCILIVSGTPLMFILPTLMERRKQVRNQG